MWDITGNLKETTTQDCTLTRHTKNMSVTEDAKSSFQSDDWYHPANSKVFINLCDTAKLSYRYPSSILSDVASTGGKQFFAVTSCIFIKYYSVSYKLLASPAISFSPKLAPNLYTALFAKDTPGVKCSPELLLHQLRRWSHTVFCIVLYLRKLNKQKCLISSILHMQSINHTVLPTAHFHDKKSIWFVSSIFLFDL